MEKYTMRKYNFIESVYMCTYIVILYNVITPKHLAEEIQQKELRVQRVSKHMHVYCICQNSLHATLVIQTVVKYLLVIRDQCRGPESWLKCQHSHLSITKCSSQLKGPIDSYLSPQQRRKAKSHQMESIICQVSCRCLRLLQYSRTVKGHTW